MGPLACPAAVEAHAESEAERRTILDRGNALGDRLLGTGAACWLVRVGADDAEGVLGGSFVEDPAGRDPFEWAYRVQPVEWRSGAFDATLADIADDAASALWMNRANGAIFAPYDGGFDLFPASPAEASALRADHDDWLSGHPGGL